MKKIILIFITLSTLNTFAGVVTILNEAPSRSRRIEQVSTDIKWNKGGALSIHSKKHEAADCIVQNYILEAKGLKKLDLMNLLLKDNVEARCHYKDKNPFAYDFQIVISSE